jgi:nitroreductase
VEFQDVVRKRKMVRSFEDRPIPREVVDRILANAQRAPSAGFSQGWAFLALEGPEQTARYWDTLWPPAQRAEFGWPDMFKAPLLVVCLSHKMAYIRRYAESDKGWTDMDEKRWPVPFWDIDTAMGAMLVLLTAVDAGLGAVYFGVTDQAKFRKRSACRTSSRPSGRSRSATRSRTTARRHRSSAAIVRRSK